MALETTPRVGGGLIELDAYGGDFASPTDLGNVNEDGVSIGDWDIQEIKEKYGNKFGTFDVTSWIDDATITLNLLTYSAQNMARMFSVPIANITDNSGGSPADEHFSIGGGFGTDFFALRLTIPQPVTKTLKDIWTFPRVKLLPYSDDLVLNNTKRYAILKFKMLLDPTTNKHIEFLGEYA